MNLDAWAEKVFNMPASVAVAFVFLLPALEASIFLGFLIPGEIAVVIGGVLAYKDVAPLWVILIAGISGAIIGDNIGYFVGNRWGRLVIDSTLGRYLNKEHIDRGERLIAKSGGFAVFIGRWTAALRALIPGLCGMSNMHYRTFVVWNIIGGTVWATTFILLGYFAGNNWQRIEHVAHNVTLVMLGLVIGAGIVAFFVIRRKKKKGATLDSLVEEIEAELENRED